MQHEHRGRDARREHQLDVRGVREDVRTEREEHARDDAGAGTAGEMPHELPGEEPGAA